MYWIRFSGLRYERYEKHTFQLLSSWTSAALLISSPSRFSWGVGQRAFHLVVLKVMISRFIGSLASVHIRKSLELSISRQNNMLSAYLESKEPVNMHTRHLQWIYCPAKKKKKKGSESRCIFSQQCVCNCNNCNKNIKNLNDRKYQLAIWFEPEFWSQIPHYHLTSLYFRYELNCSNHKASN